MISAYRRRDLIAEKSKHSLKTLKELLSNINKVVGYEINNHRWVVLLYTIDTFC